MRGGHLETPRDGGVVRLHKHETEGDGGARGGYVDVNEGAFADATAACRVGLGDM